MTPAATPVGREHRELVWGLAVTETVGWGTLYYALPVLLVPMEDEQGWSRSMIVGAYALATLLSGLAAPAVGRYLDRHDARLLMTGGSIAGTALVLAWSQAGGPVGFYAVWVGIGLVQSTVLYDAAFTVLIKRCAPHHARALLTVTLTAGLASFIFQPLTSWLAEAYGWRTALIVLAGVLGSVTIPVHWLVLRPTPTNAVAARNGPGEAPALRERRFWLLTGGFTAVATTSFAAGVLLIAYLVDHGWPLGRAALAGGTLGAMQLPGRLVFTRLAPRVSSRALAPALLALPAGGVLLLLASDGGWLVWPAVALLGIGQGSSVLLRTSLLTDLYGTASIGALNGASALPVTLARAAAPLAATVLVARTAGYATALVLLAGIGLAGSAMTRRALRSRGDVRGERSVADGAGCGHGPLTSMASSEGAAAPGGW
jgi:hypothetical protein